ncbi:MAG: NAD(P)/FAD-dependent oxidoreductase [Terriglobales bacterium]
MIDDLAVIGGGPAGTSAALTAAAHGLRVGLYESAEAPRDKVCGEFVSAEALPLLERYAPALLEAAPLITHAALTSRGGARTEFPLRSAARGVSRLALDGALWHAAVQAGVQVHPRSTVRLASRETPIAGAVIIANGRHPNPHSPGRSRWLGLKARFAGLPQRPQVELYCFPGGYCGVAPVENGWTNVCCLLRQHAPLRLAESRDFATWLAQLPGTRWLCARLEGAWQATPTVVTAGITLGPRAARMGEALAAGDASGFVDPFTGDGIARALLSGQLAAEAIASGAEADYPAALEAAAGGGFRTAAALRRALTAPGWMQTLACRLRAGPVFGPRLEAATRWQRSRGAAAPRP